MEISIYAIFALIAGISNSFFGLFVYTKNKKELSNRLFGLLSIGFSIWTFSYFIWLLQDGKEGALFWSRMLNLGATFIPPFYLHWILSILNLDKKRSWLIIFAYAITVVFVIFSFSPFYIKEVKQVGEFSYWPQAGFLYTIFLVVSYIGFVGYGFLELIHYYFKKQGELKIQIRCLITATLIGFGGGAVNFPFMYGIFLFPPIGMFLVIFHPFFFSYAVLKGHLFNIKIMATELLVGLVAVILLVNLLVSKSFSEIFLNSGILVAFLYLGSSLIKSVLREIEVTKKVQRAYEVEKRARKELNKLDEVKNQFIMASQHHLRTPLTSMRGYLELLLEGQYGKISPQVKEVLRRFNLSSERLIKIVNEFLDITQFQLGKEVIMPQPGVDLEPIFKEIVEELGMETKARGLYLRVNKPKRLPKIKADSEKLKIALFNIVDNAIKYTRKGGITINIKKTDSKVQITVKDTGVGIPKEQQKGLFNKLFVRGKEATKLHGTGRGIGLYIAYHIIKAHNGKIWVESEGKGKGTIFFIELPIS